MKTELALSMPKNVEGLIELIGDANTFLESLPLSPEALYKANLILEEMLTNTIKYSFDDASEHEIRVRIALHDAELMIEFVDDGHEFDPLSVPPPREDESIEDRDVGGLGIHIVRRIAEWMEYHRDRGKNVLKVGIKRAS